jgi:P pilus assembly chaperone PapD
VVLARIVGLHGNNDGDFDYMLSPSKVLPPNAKIAVGVNFRGLCRSLRFENPTENVVSLQELSIFSSLLCSLL